MQQCRGPGADVGYGKLAARFKSGHELRYQLLVVLPRTVPEGTRKWIIPRLNPAKTPMFPNSAWPVSYLCDNQVVSVWQSAKLTSQCKTPPSFSLFGKSPTKRPWTSGMCSKTGWPNVRRFFEGGLGFKNEVAIQVPWVVSRENATTSSA